VERILEAILRDEQAILTVSSLLTEYHGIGECASGASIVGREGVRETLPLHISDEELALLRRWRKSCGRARAGWVLRKAYRSLLQYVHVTCTV